MVFKSVDYGQLWSIYQIDLSVIEKANAYHLTIKFTAEVSEIETTFLDTTVYKGERFEKERILDVRTHFKLTETFLLTYFNSCHPAGVKKVLSKKNLSGFSELTVQKLCLRRTLENLKHA